MSKARNGEGSIGNRLLKVGTKVYDVSISFVDPKTGKRGRKQRRGFRSQAEAVAWRNSNMAKVQSKTYVPATKLTVDLKTWLDHRHGLKEQTRSSYARKLRVHVYPHLGSVKLSSLAATQLDSLYSHLCREGSPGGNGPPSKRSVREIHTILHRAFKDAVLKSSLATNPAAAASPPGAKEAQPPEFQVWSADELRTFLEAEQRGDFVALWRFLATTGCRRGEALGLRWRDVDLDNSTAAIRQTVGVISGRIVRSDSTKSGKPRVVDLDEATLQALRAHRAGLLPDRLSYGERWQDEDLVFPRGRYRLYDNQNPGGPLNPDRMSRYFKARVKAAGLPPIRLHDLRHTWATLALKAGVHPKVVQERLGHANISITLGTYSHVTAGMQREAADIVSALFT